MTYPDAHGHFHTFLEGDGVPEDCSRAVCCGTHPGDWQEVLALAERDSRVVPALGLHPWWIAGAGTGWHGELRHLLREVPEAGLGEIGLDRTRRSVPLAEQVPVLEAQLQLAREFRRPVSLHCVGAWGKLYGSVERVLPPEAPVLLHAFAGSQEMVERFAAREGVYFSFGAGARRELLAAVPREKRVFESDAFAGEGDVRPPGGAAGAIRWASRVLDVGVAEVTALAEAALDRFLGRAGCS